MVDAALAPGAAVPLQAAGGVVEHLALDSTELRGEHERAERWEQGRQARLREVNAELRELSREHREAIRQEHRRLLAGGTPRTTVIVGGGGGGGGRRAGGGALGGGPAGPEEPLAHRIINDLAATGRPATDQEITIIRQHLAAAGFDPNAREELGGRRTTELWKGKELKGSDRLPPLEVKYIRHVLHKDEWPPGTTIDEFERSVREAVLSPDGGVFLSRYKGEQGVGFVARSGSWRGPSGLNWILVDYRLAQGHIMTAYQVATLAEITGHEQRSEMRWLRLPK